MTRPGDLDTEDQARLDAILASSPELAAVTAHVRAFAALMTGRRGRDLEQWMASAAATGEPSLQSFVTGLRAGQDAVTAGLTLRWSSGSVEGHVNRINCSNARCTDARTPTCSAAAFCSPTDLTETVPDPVFTCRRHRRDSGVSAGIGSPPY